MLSSVLVAALAASALAVPFKRDVVTDIDWVVVTDVVTVYATAPTAAAQANHAYGGPPGTWEHTWDHTWDPTWQNTWTDAPTSTSVAEASPTSTSTSTFVAPAAPTSSSTWVAPPPPSSTSTWVAPAPYTSTSVYVAPAPSSTYVASTSVSAATSAPTGYAETAVWHHNAHRANQTNTGDLTWDDDLASAAQTIATGCTFAHQMNVNGLSYGQNIAAGAQDVGTVISNMWYNGEAAAFAAAFGPNYDSADAAGDFDSYGHFTQVVWRDTTTVGCYTASCAGQGSWESSSWSDVPAYFTVCNYGPAGNVAGEYAANTGQQQGLATVSGSS